MQIGDKLWNAHYWANRMRRTTDDVAPILKKMTNIPATPLTYEEKWLVRESLREYASYSNLLTRDLAQPDPKPAPLWKRIFRS